MGSASSLMSNGGPCTQAAYVVDTLSQSSDSTVASIDEIKNELKILKDISLKHIETIQDRAERYIKRFIVPVEHLVLMVDSFVHELEVGLLAHYNHPYEWNPAECSFKMLDACIHKLPTGQEKGTYYALDFGGSTFRVARVELQGNGKTKTTKTEQSLITNLGQGTLSTGLLSQDATASEMFDLFAETVKKSVEQNESLTVLDELRAGFTFSFPCSQRSIDRAVLMHWTKGFATGRNTDDPVEGLDVVELMNVAFQRKNVPVRCNAVLNDTVGTLLSCAYSMDYTAHPECLVGLILGTGSNCCYYDETAPQFKYKGKVINIECGNFNRDLPRTNVDCELDFNDTEARGNQHLEKMISGAYLGEICRLAIVRILADQTPANAWQAFSLSTESLSRIMNDKSKNFHITSKILNEVWNADIPVEHAKIIQRVASVVLDRSSALAAVLIAACAKKTGRLQKAFGGLSVGIDGSLYTRNPVYRERLRFHLNSILGDELGNLIHLLTADDGSGKGAAILAATL